MVIGIIGMGNLGKHLTKMLYSRNRLILSRTSSKDEIIKEFPEISISDDNKYIAENSNILILSVKPGQIKSVCDTISSVVDPNTPIISVAAAIPFNKLRQWLPNSKIIIRCMPNIGCSIDKGVVPYYCNKWDLDVLAIMKQVFGSNTIIFLDKDEDIDTATLISGCGPAFFSWYSKCLYKFGKDKLPDKILNRLILETMNGTRKLLCTNSYDDIIKQVASPKGATEAALESMEAEEVDVNIIKAIEAAYKRIQDIKTIL